MKKTGIFPHCCHCFGQNSPAAVCFQATFPIFHPKRALICKREKKNNPPTHLSVLSLISLVLFFRRAGGRKSVVVLLFTR